MHSFVSSSAILASTLFSAVHAYGGVHSSGGQSLAVYWGQGSNQKSLGSFCADSTIDILPIGFMNVFPDQNGTHGYPGTNFGNACGGYYIDSKNETTQLLGSCPQIAADITYCQSQGKKILLSLGGASTGVFVASDDSAVAFGDFLHGAFGPPSSSWTGPRPFGDVCVDGFDFDIEASASAIPVPLGAHYATMVNHLRTLGTMMITASPQCIVPDANMGDALANAYFDAIFVQFYNTPQCSARAFFDNTYGAYGGPATDISYDSWISWMQANSKNPDALVYLGLPADTGATFGEMYLNTTEAQEILLFFQSKYPAQFGGAMLWDATFSDNNQVNGMSYAANVKSFLTGSSGTSTSASSVPSSTATTSATSTHTSPTFSPTGTGSYTGSGSYTGIGSGYPIGSPTVSPIAITDASGTYTPTNTDITYTGRPTDSSSSVGPVTTSASNSYTHTYTPSQSPTTSSSIPVVTATDRNGNTYTYTSTNIQPTGTSFSSASSSSSADGNYWSAWNSSDPTWSTSADPVLTSTITASPIPASTTSTGGNYWPSWDPTTSADPTSTSTASPISTSTSSSGNYWPAWETTSSVSYEATVTASDAITLTIMPLPASSTPEPSIASWSSYWTQRESLSYTSESAASASYSYSSPAAPASTSSAESSFKFTGWASMPSYSTLASLPSIATLTAATSVFPASTSAGAVGATTSTWASGSARPSVSVYVQPAPFTGGGNVARPVGGVLAALFVGALVMVL